MTQCLRVKDGDCCAVIGLGRLGSIYGRVQVVQACHLPFMSPSQLLPRSRAARDALSRLLSEPCELPELARRSAGGAPAGACGDAGPSTLCRRALAQRSALLPRSAPVTSSLLRLSLLGLSLLACCCT